MKTSLLFLTSVLFCAITFAQSVPQGINYQAVARDSTGNEIINQNIFIRLSVLEGNPNGTLSWHELHQVATNDFGLFTVVIGQSTLPPTGWGSSATFDSINWGSAPHFLKVELLMQAGGTYLDMGTTQFMSVPYALHAGNPGPTGATGPAGPAGPSGTGVSTATYSIGDFAHGGIVFYITADSTHGLVVATQDHHPYMGRSWYQSSEACKDPSNHSVEGQKYFDWRLPSTFELHEIHLNLYLQGLGQLNDGPPNADVHFYWSSTASGTNFDCDHLFAVNMASNSEIYSSKSIRRAVRAVRAF